MLLFIVFCTTSTAQTKVANFKDDFNLSPVSSDWKYYWNKPNNWQAGSNPGILSSGAIGVVSSYTPLVSEGTMLSADGDLNGTNSSPDRFIRLDENGGHPGAPGTNTLLDRYVISAYTVGTPGNYYILNSSLNFPNPKGNGVMVYVHINNKDGDLNKNLAGSGALSFDVSLGNLDIGDVIYVAVGANGHAAYDGFQWNFDISIVDTPETHDYYVSDYGAAGNGSSNDMDAIRNAVTDFVNDPFPSNLHFESKTYRCTGSGILFDLQGAKNKNIFGNNAELIVQPSILGLVMENSKNITVKDLTFDSDPLSWTQGTITAINSATKKFTLTVDDGYPIPTNNYGDSGRAHPWGMVWEPTGYTIKNELVFVTSSTAVSGNSVNFTVDDRSFSAFNDMNVNDRFTIDTYGVGGTFNRITKSSNITCENIIVYATRALQFVIDKNEGAIHMDGIQVRRKPGTNRLLSGYRDGFHCKDNKVGPIIENCYIEGICDDAINLHSTYFFVTAAASATQFTIDNTDNFDIGDTLQYYNMNTGVALGKTQIATISGLSITTTSAVNGVVAGTPKTNSTTSVINLSKSNSGFIIRNNNFAGQRRYAMLIRSQNGLIENNIGVKTGGGIILTNEIRSFFEGPVPSDIIIKNNSFTDIRGWPIWLDSKSYGGTSNGLLKNIVLENNTFGPSRDGKPAAIFTDVENLELSGNDFINDIAYGAIAFENCREVSFLCDNTYNGTDITNLTNDIALGANISSFDISFNCTSLNVSSIEIDLFETIIAYPNPSNGNFEIVLPSDKKEVTIDLFSMHSQFISSNVYTAQNGKIQINIGDKPAGIYFIKINLKKPVMLKIIKQ